MVNAFAQLFRGKTRWELGDLTTFGGVSYAEELRSRARSPSEFASVISEIWIANAIRRKTGREVAPVLRRDQETPDFSASGGAQSEVLLIECKLLEDPITNNSIQRKLAKANSQFKKEDASRGSVLVLQIGGIPVTRRMEELGQPEAISATIAAIKRRLGSGLCKNVSGVALIWDEAYESSGQLPIIRTLRRSAHLELHRHAKVPLEDAGMLDGLGATLFITLVKNPLYWSSSSGPYSVRGRVC